jgi:hypothetical protein
MVASVAGPAIAWLARLVQRSSTQPTMPRTMIAVVDGR